VFGSLLIQSVALGVIALIIGPILALIFVSLISQHVLGSTEQAAIDLVTGQPVQAMFSVVFYALATVIVAIIAMAFMLWLAARKNALAIRREAARTTQRPLWQRLNLDAITAVIALVGYGVSLYLVSINNLFDARTRVLVVAPLTLVAPLFLLIAFLFLFLTLLLGITAVGGKTCHPRSQRNLYVGTCSDGSQPAPNIAYDVATCAGYRLRHLHVSVLRIAVTTHLRYSNLRVGRRFQW
jgi:hypothetical protein